jgi:transcriptional regulator with XRE-family HTH domain
MRNATSDTRHGALYAPNGVKVAGETNPTLRRRELGFLLRQYRIAQGLSVEDVTERLLFSSTKLSRIETGRAGVSPRDIRDLCDLYDVTDTAERQRLIELAKEGKQRAWWQAYDLPYATYVGLEAEAKSISEYHSDLIAGLLQVESYARALFQSAEPPLDNAAIEQRIEARLKRQTLLTREPGAFFNFILDEGALRRPVGGVGAMRTQLERIVQVASLPNVLFQVVEMNFGAHPGMDSNFTILEFQEPMVNDVVYVEGLVGNIYLESATELERYRRVFSRLRAIALSPNDSITLVTQIVASLNNT